MFQKTDSSEFASGFLWQICLLTIIAIVFVMFSQKTWEKERLVTVTLSQTILYPWVLAGGHTIENGILAFSGKPPQAPKVQDRARVLASMFISMIFCPTLFLLEWRRRKLAAGSRAEQAQLRSSSVLYALTGALTLYVGAAILPISYMTKSSFGDLRFWQAVQSNRDAMINEMNMLDMKLEEYYILPKRLGGGDGSFEGFVSSQQQATTDEATYTVTGKKDVADIHAQSIRYPSSWIEVKVDTLRHMWEWKYGGEFLR
jgi:hypothetical protein